MNRHAVQLERGPRYGTKEYEKKYFPLPKPMSPEMFMGSPLLTYDMMIAHMASLPPYYSSMPDYFAFGMYPPVQPVHEPAGPAYPPTPPQFDATAVEQTQSQAQVSEKTAQILFAIVKYTKQQCYGILLPDQKKLLLASWRQLFFLKAVEINLVTEFPLILETLEDKFHKQKTEQSKNVLHEGNLSDLILKQMADFKITLVELDLMRAVILFRTIDHCDPAEFRKPRLITKRFTVAEKVMLKGFNKKRLEKIAQCLNNVDSVTPFSIEEMFFRPAIGPNTLITAIMNMLDPIDTQPAPATNSS